VVGLYEVPHTKDVMAITKKAVSAPAHGASSRLPGRRHHDGDAVRREERGANPLEDAKRDEHRQGWG
jgi:hypothetical protein